MRFAFISNNTAAPWGGSEELWSQTSRRLAEAGHRVLACLQDWRPVPPKAAGLRSFGVTVTAFRHRKVDTIGDMIRRGFKRRLPSTAERTIVRMIAPFRPDLVVISQMMNYDGLGLMQACDAHGLHYAVIAQSASEMFWPNDEESSALRQAFENARGVFFVSVHNRQLTEMQIAGSIPSARIVRNPFLTEFDQPWTWPGETAGLRLACVARLAPGVKGQDLLFRVLAQPKWRERPLQVTLFGRGNERTLRTWASQLALKQVSFGGQTDNVAGIWREHHGLVLTSRFEGLPLAVVEAMLAHRVCIVTPAGGTGEVVTDGDTGFVAASATFDSVDVALERAWDRRNEWAAMGRRAGVMIRQLVPRDPAAVFAKELIELVASRD